MTDPESMAHAVRRSALTALDELKAVDIVELDVRDRASFTDFMLFASGNSTRHVSAIADAVIEAARHATNPPLGIEGQDIAEWILVDLGDVIVHVMLPEVRAYYELEKLWGEELANS